MKTVAKQSMGSKTLMELVIGVGVENIWTKEGWSDRRVKKAA
jgi:hypothetical protein